MTPTECSVSHKELLVDDDDAVRDMMTVTLEHKGLRLSLLRMFQKLFDISRPTASTLSSRICTCRTPAMVLPCAALNRMH